MSSVVALVASYLLGAIPTSYLVAKHVAGIDLRQHGSNNLGATNLYRVLGWRYAIPVGIFDLLKGAVPVWIFGPMAGGGAWLPVLCGAMAVVGHVFSVFARFKGGKGVATGAGVVLAMAPWAFAVALVVWVVTVRLSGYVSLGSVLAAVVFPVAAYVLHPARRSTLWLNVALAALVIIMHRANIVRLLNGTESRFGRSASSTTAPPT
ncbi:MAG: glycerol-3-phosphate 1-O-acyltransferase PlsY [Gemmatimonadota bacterium]